MPDTTAKRFEMDIADYLPSSTDDHRNTRCTQ